MFSSSMKLNEKNVISFASSDSPVDKEGYLSRKNDVKGYQRRWFVLKGNLLFSYERKQDKEPSGLLVLESCGVQASATEKHGFEISYDGVGTRTYVLVADHDDDMQSWMRAISHASYDVLKTIVSELQRQVNALTSHSGQEDGRKIRGQSNDGKIPMAPKPKTKVENGILVDIVEAPPIPPKKKQMTVQKSPSPEPGSVLSQSKLPINPNKPHSSPVVIPTVTGNMGVRSSLSPPGTLDRTPIMIPTVTMTPESGDDYDVPPPPVPSEPQQEDDLPTQPFVNLPTTHTISVVKGMAAPPCAHNDTLQLHQDFTEAFSSLQSGKTT